MNRDRLIERLMATFLEELQDHVRVFNRELLALERVPTGEAAAESIKVLFRSAHSLKGAARSVQANKLATRCHQLEGLLAAVRDGQREVTGQVLQELFAGVDEFEAAGKELREEREGGGAGRGSGVGRDLGTGAGAGEDSSTGGDSSTRTTTSTSTSTRLGSLGVGRGRGERPGGRVAGIGVEEAGVVRVPGRRLDALLAQCGEVLVARRRFDGRQVELAALQDTVVRWRAEWRLVHQTLKHWQRPVRSDSAVSGARNGVPPRVLRFVQNSGEQLVRIERELERVSASLSRDRNSLERAAQPLQQLIHAARLVPFVEACEGLFRSVRDLAGSQNKEVDLVIEGGDTELDRSIIDGLRSPLLHLIRNAVGHGAELPEERIARGKPRRATIRVRAALRGDLVELAVSDDGRGLDIGAIREQIEKRGQRAPSDDAELAGMIFQPGFSTAPSVTHVAGRGVGLDVVKAQIEAMRGTIELSSNPGAGTRMVFTLPLTLTTVRVLFLRAGGESLALPTAGVQTLIRAGAANLGAVEGRDMLLLGAAPIPIASLAATLGLPATAAPARVGDKVAMVVIGADDQRVALAVDELLAEQDVVLKALPARIRGAPHIVGATILADGRLCLVLKPLELARAAMARTASQEWSTRFAARAPAAPKRLLLVDDSITTRTLEKSILEAAGHEVTTAADGAAAWKILQEQGADLVVTDVDMPNMNGFALTETIRKSKRFKNLPVILLTGLHTDRDRARGLEIGADAYLLKTAFDQKILLETIRHLL